MLLSWLVSAAALVSALDLPSTLQSTQVHVPQAGYFNWTSITPNDTLQYHSCYGKFQCARLVLPMDWNNKHSGSKVIIGILTLPATVSRKDPSFKGSVLVNPGGPGISGTSMVLSMGEALKRLVDWEGDLQRHYEIVGFDIRGSGVSEPSLNCFKNDVQRQRVYSRIRASGALSGGEKGAMNAVITAQQEYAAACAFAHGSDLQHFSTFQSVMDMKEIFEQSAKFTFTARNTSFDKEIGVLNYIGFSYGTFLGLSFAQLFPQDVGRMLLDGIVDARDNAGAWGSLSAVGRRELGADAAFSRFVVECVDAGSNACPFASPQGLIDVGAPLHWAWSRARHKAMRKTILDWVANHDYVPVAVLDHNNNTHIVTGSEILAVFSNVLKSPRVWKSFAEKLHRVMAGTDSLISLVKPVMEIPHSAKEQHRIESEERPKGSNRDPRVHGPEVRDLQAAAMCADSESTRQWSPYRWHEWLHELVHGRSQIAGRSWAPLKTICARWPEPSSSPHTIIKFWKPHTKKDWPNMLFLSTALDPVTPQTSAKRMQRYFPQAQLVIQNNTGHTALGSGYSNCTETLVRQYFATGTLGRHGRHYCDALCTAWDEKCTLHNFADNLRNVSSSSSASAWFDDYLSVPSLA